jgi:hypothetical protein
VHNTIREIDANGFRYLSQIPEFKEGLPFGILNKVITDVGGTFAALNCDCNYIIVTPTIDLVQSIQADNNVKFKVFGVFGRVFYSDFQEYIKVNSTHKIAVTYDSLPKVVKWLDRNNCDSKKYKVLVDEYHLLLEDMDYRSEAILRLIEQIKHFDHYTYMSATPIQEIHLPKFLEDLPYNIVKWSRVFALKPTRWKVANVFQVTVRLIQEFKAGMMMTYNETPDTVKVEQLFIFLNSVKGIKQIIDTAELTDDEVKVVCSDNIWNEKTLRDISISKVTEPNAPINFFTKKGFQGCNLFSNNALVVVVSDGHKKHTLVDISTTLHQIAGRLRENSEYNNILKDHLWHIYSTTKLFRTDEEFIEELERMKKETAELIINYKSGTPEFRSLLLKQIDTESLLCYYNPKTDEYIYSEDKAGSMIYKHHLANHIYSNGVLIQNAYKDAGFLADDNAEIEIYDDDILMKKLTTIGFRELLSQYIDLRKVGTNTHLIAKYELENSLFQPAYDQLGESGIKTCKWMESKIKDRVIATSPDTILLITNEFFKQVGNEVFISKANAKKLLQTIYEKNKIKGVRPSLSVLSQSKWFITTETQKRVDRKQTNGIILKQIRYPVTMNKKLKQI